MAFAVDMIVNQGTDYEYSLSLPIRQLLNNGTWTIENIKDYIFAGLTDTRVQGICNVPPDTEVTSAATNRNYVEQYNLTSFQSWSNNVPNRIINRKGESISDFIFYQRNILVSPASPGSTALGLDSLRLVLDIKDIKKFMMDFDTNSCHSQVSLISENGNTPTGNGYTGAAYHWGSNITVGPTITSRATPPAGTTIALHVASVSIINNELWWGYLNPSNNHNEFATMSGYSRRQYNIYGGSSQAQEYLAGKRGMQTASSAKYAMYAYIPGTTAFPESADGVASSSFKDFYIITTSGNIIYSPYLYNNDAQGVALTASQAISGYLAKDYNTLLTWLSWCGLYFKIDNVLYKPIITGGIITGYTSDMSRPSEFDNMRNVTGNTVPDTPPAPGPGPYDDDPWNGVSFSGVTVGGIGAFARCYYMTSTELQNLRSWMGSTSVPEGFDPMAQIIGLSQVPVPLSGDAPENIQFINSSAVYDPGVTSRVVDSGVASQYAMGAPIKYTLGSVNIARRMQERGEPYLDYSCQVELYLPLVGVFSLDTQAVMDRTISAEAVLDPVSGTLAAYAWVEKGGQRLPVAYGSTSIGVDLPVTAQQYSVARAALKQANAQLGTSLLSSALTMIAAATSSGNAAARGGQSISSGANNAAAGNAYAQSASIAASQTMLSQTGNVFGSFMEWGRTVRQLSYGNNTAISGSFGGSTAQWSYPFEAYVKIIRPRYEKPANYNHSQGVPCVQAKKIGSCTGFIQCINVDVSGITRATDLERQAIQAALCNGVYAGGGQ